MSESLTGYIGVRSGEPTLLGHLYFITNAGSPRIAFHAYLRYTMASSEIPLCFPTKRLENSRLVLAPFDFASYADRFVKGTRDYPELFAYVTQGPFSTVGEFAAWYKFRIQASNAETLFAILVKPQTVDEEESFAGVIGLQNAKPINASIEIGFVCFPLEHLQGQQELTVGCKITILPAFQRTFVTSNAVGLLLLYTLDPPPAGLGLRRCQWQAHASNEPSRRVAARMHFTFEGVQRFQRVVPKNKTGNGFDTSRLPTVAGADIGQSRDSAVFAHYCDEWPEKRGKVLAVMDRPIDRSEGTEACNPLSQPVPEPGRQN
jgi:RimJ/RimL family protein N-acetyltransferase